jgi:hypothetical protein
MSGNTIYEKIILSPCTFVIAGIVSVACIITFSIGMYQVTHEWIPTKCNVSFDSCITFTDPEHVDVTSFSLSATSDVCNQTMYSTLQTKLFLPRNFNCTEYAERWTNSTQVCYYSEYDDCTFTLLRPTYVKNTKEDARDNRALVGYIIGCIIACVVLIVYSFSIFQVLRKSYSYTRIY